MSRVHSLLLFALVFAVVFWMLHYLSVATELSLCFIAIWISDYIYRRINIPFIQKPLLPELRDKAVLITGCDTGFGHELARRLDNIGVTVFAGCLFPEGSGALELKALCSNNLKVIQLDITNEDHVAAAVKEVSLSLGDKKLWAVVNNAGIITYGDTEICSMKNMKKVFEVNVIGTLRVTQAFLPMIRESQGRIVIVASIAGRISINGMVAYSMSKHATVALADGLRREMLKFGVSVHLIEPWMYSTNINSEANLLQQLNENWKQAPEDVTTAYGDQFLNECENYLTTGQKEIAPPYKIHEVVNDMIHATLGQQPKIRYEEGTPLAIKLLINLPSQIPDYFFYLKSPRYIKGSAPSRTT